MSAFFLTGICKHLFMGFLLMHSIFEKAKSTAFHKNSDFLRKEEAARRRENGLGRPSVKYLRGGPRGAGHPTPTTVLGEANVVSGSKRTRFLDVLTGWKQKEITIRMCASRPRPNCLSELQGEFVSRPDHHAAPCLSYGKHSTWVGFLVRTPGIPSRDLGLVPEIISICLTSG